MKVRKRNLVVLSVLLLFIVSCSHNLQVKNLNRYTSPMSYNNELITIGIVSDSEIQTEFLLESILSELHLQPNITLKYPYKIDQNNPVDYIIEYKINSKYRGSWANFFISWPGFIIFTPAWHGYVYYVDFYTDIIVNDNKTLKPIITKSHKMTYKCVQAEFDRTWIELGYFEYGILPLIGGLFFTEYDNDITEEFNYEVKDPYGKYIARKTSLMLAGLSNK